MPVTRCRWTANYDGITPMLAWLFGDPLPVGSLAPPFALTDENQRAVSLKSLKGRPVVLVFYPGDDTAIRTEQLCQFATIGPPSNASAPTSTASTGRAPTPT